MAKLKSGSYTPQEEAILKAIPRDSKSTAAITKAAKTMNRGYPTVWQKWHSLWQKKNPNPTLSAGKKLDKANIPAMKLEFDPNYEPKKAGIDEEEKISFIKGLEPELKKLLPLKGAINIPTRFEKTAKEYFSKHTSHIYAVTSIKGNSRMRKVIMKY